MSRPSYKSYYDEYCNAKKACDEQEKQGKVVYRPHFEQYKDIVNHPKHYISESGMEVINVVEEFTKGLEGIEAACSANMIKYACRWKNKNGVQDLEKLVWYANHLIEHLKKQERDDAESPEEKAPIIYYFDSEAEAKKLLDILLNIAGQNFIKASGSLPRLGFATLEDYYSILEIYFERSNPFDDDDWNFNYAWTYDCLKRDVTIKCRTMDDSSIVGNKFSRWYLDLPDALRINDPKDL